MNGQQFAMTLLTLMQLGACSSSEVGDDHGALHDDGNGVAGAGKHATGGSSGAHNGMGGARADQQDDDADDRDAGTPQAKGKAVQPPAAGAPSKTTNAAGGAGSNGAVGNGQAGQAASASVAAAAPTVSDEIISVGFNVKTDPELSREPIPVPVLLYKGGYASAKPDLVVHPVDIAFDVVEHPDAWPTWRRDSGKLQLKAYMASEWNDLHFQFECAPLAQGTKLQGTFEWVSDRAIGSTAAVKTIWRYRFKNDGSFESCQSVLTAIPAAPSITREYNENSGSYEIDGYKLKVTRMKTMDELTLPFFYDPMRPARLWLGTNHYVVPKDDIPEICRVP